MAKDPAFLFYVKDWIDGTAELSPREKGVYIDLLCYQHQRGGLPLEPSRLSRLSRLSQEEFDEIWSVIKCKFVQQNYMWINIRLQNEMFIRASKGKKKRISGIFACLIKKDNLTKEQLSAIKKDFSVDLFLEFPDDVLQQEITIWYTKWFGFGDGLVGNLDNHSANANANANKDNN